MDEELREKIKEFIFVLYGLDIDKAKFTNAASCYLFQFEDEEEVIKVNKTKGGKKKEALAEAYFADDLKLFKETICEPVPSKNGHMIEEFRIGKVVYIVEKYKKAKGKTITGRDFGPMFFICAGELLGAIHKTSTSQRIEGMKYKRPSLLETLRELKNENVEFLNNDMIEKLNGMIETVVLSSNEVGRYGLCHGLYERSSFLKDENNIWLFDFSNCVYANYLLDVANFVLDVMIAGYKMPDCDAKKIIELEILPFFKMGYLINKKVPSNFFEEFDTYLEIAALRKYLIFCNADEGTINGKPISVYTTWLEKILSYKTIYEGISDTRVKQLQEIRNNLYR